jgi:hypothetical protein
VRENDGSRAVFFHDRRDFARFEIVCVPNLQHAPTLLPGAVVGFGAAR